MLRVLLCRSSTIVDPWGKVLSAADAGEATISAEVAMSVTDDVRAAIPVSKQRRKDLYEVVDQSL